MAPSQIQIATSSLQRLLKEEASYFKEQEQQEARIQKLEKQDPATADSDGNQEFVLKQEVCPILPRPAQDVLCRQGLCLSVSEYERQ